MKIVVFSDAHGNLEAVKRICLFNPDADYKISLGDLELEEDFLRRNDITYVRGNYPRDPGFLYDSNLTVMGKKIFFTHGHKHSVRFGIGRLLKIAQKESYDICLYGHTHVAKLDYTKGVYIANPGSCSRPRTSLPPTYLIITIDKEVSFTFKDVMTNETIEFS